MNARALVVVLYQTSAGVFVFSGFVHPLNSNSNFILDPTLKTTTGQRTFYSQAVKLWNDLKDRLKFCKKVNTFKFTMQRKYL